MNDCTQAAHAALVHFAQQSVTASRSIAELRSLREMCRSVKRGRWEPAQIATFDAGVVPTTWAALDRIRSESERPTTSGNAPVVDRFSNGFRDAIESKGG